MAVFRKDTEMSQLSSFIKTPTFSEVETSYTKLNSAIIGHSKWLAEWNTRVICWIPVQEKYFSEQSHRNCYFGQWYYGEQNNYLKQKLEFSVLDEQHRLVHDRMRGIVKKANNGESIARVEYDNFINSEAAFSESLINLRDELYKLLLSFDYLTGAFNRQAFFRILEQEHARVTRFNETVSIVLLDVDKFKTINDKFGHTAGDKVLASIANFVINNMRPYDSMCRYGGEEFLICMPNTTTKESHNIIDRIREELSQKPIYISSDNSIKISASFGIAPMLAGDNLEATIENADNALYHAKTNGRNKVVIWSAHSLQGFKERCEPSPI